jgi:transposase
VDLVRNVEQFLEPTLGVGDGVVMDDLAAHKVTGEAIRAAEAGLLGLPPSSPDLNPIERFFATLKTLLRTAAGGCGTLGSRSAIFSTASAPASAATISPIAATHS